MADLGKEFGWDDEIVNDGEGFEVLPAGDYDFEVKGFERARFEGSDKMAPCPKAVMSIRISSGDDATTLNHNFFLNTKSEWKICEFYTAIGFRKKGEPLKMAWQKTIGAKGRCKVSVRKWNNKNTGDEMTSNEITKFYEPTESTAGQPQQASGWSAGKF